MSEAELREAMAGGQAAFILSDKPEEADYRRSLLRRCARGVMQLWRDLEREDQRMEVGQKALA
ncbi:hypothetical protein [Acetobacter sp. LMG 32666]|uniref:hypothetical protein n=1 Tax=Acetobacter sp. LMG 32666 TaxID=2959295 RepID=UPI0030C7D511